MILKNIQTLPRKTANRSANKVIQREFAIAAHAHKLQSNLSGSRQIFLRMHFTTSPTLATHIEIYIYLYSKCTTNFIVKDTKKWNFMAFNVRSVDVRCNTSDT